MKRRPLSPWLVSIALATAPIAVLAQQETTHAYPACTNTSPGEVEVNTAKAAFQLGQASFNEGNYKKAIENWEEALRRDCTASALLLNLARAYELDGQKQQAVVALQAYLDRKPDTPQRDQIERRIETLNKQIAAQAPVATAPTATATAPSASSTAPPPPPPGGKRPILPLIVAGAGGVILVGGGIGYVIENGRVKDFQSQCPNNSCPDPSIRDSANSAVNSRKLMGGIAVAGLVIGAGGLVWYFLSKPQGDATTTGQLDKRRLHPQVTPVVGSGFTGVAVTGAF